MDGDNITGCISLGGTSRSLSHAVYRRGRKMRAGSKPRHAPFIERIATRHIQSPSPAEGHMMCSFRHTAFSGGCHLRVACHLVRSEFHPAYPNAPLPDDSSRDDADKESEHSKRAARDDFEHCIESNSRTRIAPPIQPTHLSMPPTSLCIQRRILMRQNAERSCRGCHRCQRKPN